MKWQMEMEMKTCNNWNTMEGILTHELSVKFELSQESKNDDGNFEAQVSVLLRQRK